MNPHLAHPLPARNEPPVNDRASHRPPSSAADRPTDRTRLRTAVARYSTTAYAVTAIPLIGFALAGPLGLIELLPEPVRVVLLLLALPIAALFVLGFAAQFLPRPIPQGTVALRSPVRGRWRAMNSPATKVPSHGTHIYGQTFAIDLVHEPAPGTRPVFADGGGAMRDPRDYPAFDQPAHAPVAGRVMRVRDGARDHRARSNWLGYLYMLVEGIVLQLRGPSGAMGNHVIIEVADGGPYVAVAHLRRGSVAVAVGDRVAAGAPIGRVGNSGNSSEPHVHLHVADRAAPTRALGVPFTFTDVVLDDDLDVAASAEVAPAVPANDQLFHAGVTPAGG